ncbi:MAG: TldD/PmbA family protein [Candidatus Heimdallarchaeota archaeon]
MIDEMLKGIAYGNKFKVDFIDIRYQEKYRANFQSRDGELTADTGSRRGFSTRVIIDGALGFASTTSIALADLKSAIEAAAKLARSAAPAVKEKIVFADVKPQQDKVETNQVKLLQNVSIAEKMEMIKEAEKTFKDFSEVKSYTIGYDEMIDHRIVVNNEGTQIEQKIAIPAVRVQATAVRGTKIASYHDAWSKAKGFELVDEHPLVELAQHVAETATKNLDATLPPGGPTKVVIDNTVVGILAHEAVGHLFESDLVEAGSFAKGKLGQKIVSELITIIDAPVLEDASGWYMYDDEGTKGRAVELIKNGVVSGFMNNRFYAAKYDMEPTGNARAFNFNDEPLVRMRNTYIVPGDFSDEELFEAVKDGLFVTGFMNGSADTSGEFMVGTGQAIEIKNGKLTDKVFIGPTMSGNSIEVLSSTLGVGKELALNLGTGFCGKEQLAKVDAGGGKVACTVILGGR